MSAHYDLIPLANTWRPLAEIRAWLENMGLVIPDDWQNSRSPSASEVRSVVRQLAEENYFTEPAEFHILGDDLAVTLTVNGDDTFLSIADYRRDREEDTPRRISFEYGSPELVLTVCERLSHLRGPFLLTNNGAFFVIVSIGTRPDANWAADDF